ncbi:hypothetical protein [Brevundimonas nasdae]|uniref:Uncharacterized protein n=1 Tax=Brevundimonas nasdae TaxID=172043 RepID=A0ABX8TIS0_9CAUL|nr:hypothetical protein [Brevundimonas nasdae]QYC10668.1 hypothetical protein KWG56_01210 [Brevundimonas nasdae]QYC13455.1 hypothetical protein KWG63_14765 [Brevundimonas nasdae]
MTRYTICYSAHGTDVLRTESVTAEEAHLAIAQVQRRLGASQIFREAKVFEDGQLRFNVSADPKGVAAIGAR